jgi:hypothetical protein
MSLFKEVEWLDHREKGGQQDQQDQQDQEERLDRQVAKYNSKYLSI